jgi:hypothetical protein
MNKQEGPIGFQVIIAAASLLATSSGFFFNFNRWWERAKSVPWLDGIFNHVAQDGIAIFGIIIAGLIGVYAVRIRGGVKK